MDKNKTALENKINEFDRYLCENFNPQKPETLYGADGSTQRAQFEQFTRDLYSMTQSCSFKTEEEIALRNRALVQLQVLKVADDVRKTQFDASAVPDEGSDARKEYDIKLKARDEAILKYSCALAGVEKGEPNISTKIDIDQITWVQSADPQKLAADLDCKGVQKAMNADPQSSLFELKNSVFGKGGMTAYTFLIPNPDGKGYKLDTAKSAGKMMSDLLSGSKMKDMIDSYTKSEKSWVTSAMTPTQEIENRLRMVNAYSTELKSIYAIMNSDAGQNPEVQKAFNKVFQKKGITELMKDFKTFNDPENKKTDFLMEGTNKYDKEFRKGYKEVKDNFKDSLTKDEALRDVHKYLLGYGDYGTGVTTDVTKTEKQARPFIENFISMPEKDQMKALYMLENKMYKTPDKVTDEMLEDYKPNTKKIDKVLRATNFKFWKRANSSYMYWNKLKTCVDKVHDAAQPKKQPDKSAKAMKIGKIVTKVGSVAAQISGHLKVSNALNVTSAVIGSASAIKKMAKEAEVTTSAEKADVVLGEIGKQASNVQKMEMMNAVSSMVSKSLPQAMKYMKAAQGVAVASNAIMTTKSIANIVTSKKNIGKVADLNKDIKSLMKDKSLSKEQKDILTKLETSTRMLKVINKDKVKIATAETVKNSTALVCSTAMAAGAGPAALIPQAIVGIGTKIAESKIKSNDTRNVIDAKLYASEEEKKQKIDTMKGKIAGKYLRLPKHLQTKYEEQMGEVISSDKKMLAQMRQEAVRESGQVNLQATKQSYLVDISKDIFKLLKSGAEKVKDGTLTKLDKKITDLANKFVKAAGGKEIDLKKLGEDSQKSKEYEQKAMNKLTQNMTL